MQLPDNILPIGLMAVIFGSVAAGLLISVYRSRKRTEAFQRFAEELGFEFVTVGSEIQINSLGQFQLFSLGHKKRITNLVREVCDRCEVNVFDYHYVTGSGNRAKTTRTTVLRLLIDGPQIPRFVLQPEGIWHKFESWLGSQDIDFHTHQDFSSSYLLRGNDEPKIRSLFADEVLEYYGQNPGIHTEGMGLTLLHYRQGRMVPADELRTFLSDGMQVLSLFLRSAPSTPHSEGHSEQQE